MQTNYLLPNKYKILGWILFIPGIITGIILFLNEYETNFANPEHKDGILGVLSSKEYGIFVFLDSGFLDELIALAIIIGGLLLVLTKEKLEDEFIYKLRTDSLVWAIIFNYVILSLTILFVYDLAFFDVLVFNMFTPLIFFVIRFNFLKLKSRSDEE